MNLNVIKKIVSVSAIVVWLVLLLKIFQAGGAMSQQLPKCIFTTIIVFSILSLIVKFIEAKQKEDSTT